MFRLFMLGVAHAELFAILLIASCSAGKIIGSATISLVCDVTPDLASSDLFWSPKKRGRRGGQETRWGAMTQRRWCDDSLWVEAALLQLQHKTNQSHVHVTPSVKDSSTCVLVGPTVLISHSSTGVGSLWSDPRSAGGVGQADSGGGGSRHENVP